MKTRKCSICIHIYIYICVCGYALPPMSTATYIYTNRPRASPQIYLTASICACPSVRARSQYRRKRKCISMCIHVHARICSCLQSTRMRACTHNDQSVATHPFCGPDDRNAARAPSGRDAPFPPDHPTSQRPARPNGPTRLRRTGDK